MGAGGKTPTSLHWTTLFYDLRNTYVILMKICLDELNLSTKGYSPKDNFEHALNRPRFTGKIRPMSWD